MTIEPKEFDKKKRGHGPLMVNVRIRPTSKRGAPPTRAEILHVLQSILDTRTVPEGWAFAGVDWRNPKKASSGWRTGDIADLLGDEAGGGFRAVLTKMIQSAKIAIVARRDVRPIEEE